MKSKLLIIALCLFSGTVFCQDLVFDLRSKKVSIPMYESDVQWEWGSNCIHVIFLESDNIRDTVLTTIGCSQWKLSSNSDSSILKICLWPYSYYSTDCALEDGIRPNPDEADLYITYVFKQENIIAKIHWEQKINQIVCQHYMPSVCKLLQNGASVMDIIKEVESIDYHDGYEYDEFSYWKDVIIHILPLNDTTYYGKDIKKITECFELLNKKYPSR